jgi:hypothetical protein
MNNVVLHRHAHQNVRYLLNGSGNEANFDRPAHGLSMQTAE